MYDINNYGRHKSRLVTDGNLNGISVESVYSGVFYLRSIHILVFLADTNKMETWATDIGNTYLEANTLDKFYIIAGTEFGDKEGKTIIFTK